MNKVKAFFKWAAGNDLVMRLVHTFWQSFVAVWAVSGFSLDKVVLTAAVAAGLSALKGAVVTARK